MPQGAKMRNVQRTVRRAHLTGTTGTVTTPQAYRGESIGLPQSGSGSLSTTGPRLGAFVVDALASALVAALFVHHHGSHLRRQAARLLEPDPARAGLRRRHARRRPHAGHVPVRAAAGPRRPRGARSIPWRAVVRTLLLFLLVPAVVFDRDGRGLHDRLTDTAVVRA